MHPTFSPSFLSLFSNVYHRDMSSNRILNLIDSFLSWSCAKGCKQNEVLWRSPWPRFISQSDSGLVEGSNAVLTMWDLVWSMNYCLLSSGGSWVTFKWAHDDQRVHRLCTSICLLTCLAKKRNRACSTKRCL